MKPDPYRCPYCGKHFVVPSMTTYHVEKNQCSWVPRPTRKGKKQ